MIQTSRKIYIRNFNIDDQEGKVKAIANTPSPKTSNRELGLVADIDFFITVFYLFIDSSQKNS